MEIPAGWAHESLFTTPDGGSIVAGGGGSLTGAAQAVAALTEAGTDVGDEADLVYVFTCRVVPIPDG